MEERRRLLLSSSELDEEYYRNQYFTVTALEDDTTINIRLKTGKFIYYSSDGINWSTVPINSNTATFELNKDESKFLKASGLIIDNNSSYTNFLSDKNIIISGNILSLVLGDNFKTATSFGTGSNPPFANIFQGNLYLVDCSNLIFPDFVSANCYTRMFSACNKLEYGPKKLPAITLLNNCYSYMFNGCTNLKIAPELPALTLVSGCYTQMFKNCIKLNYIKAAFTTTPSSSYMNGWVDGISSNGTFVKNNAATWTSSCGTNTYPCHWTIETYTP